MREGEDKMVGLIKATIAHAEQKMGPGFKEREWKLKETDDNWVPQPWIDFAHGIAESTQNKARPIIAEKFRGATFVRLTPNRASLTVLSDSGVLGEISLADALGLK